MSTQRSDWRERVYANPSRMEREITIRLQDDQIGYLTQAEILVTTADLYFPLEPRPLLVFVDGQVHHGTAQMAKDEELRALTEERIQNPRTILRQYSDKKRDQLYQEILDNLG